MPGPTTEYTKTTLPIEYLAVPISQQPFSDIENQYNKLVRSVKELWACINGAATGVNVNGTPLTDYSAAANLGILPRLVDIEDSGKINDSAVVQIGATLSASNRGVRFTLGSTALYSEIQWNNASSVFVLQDQAGTLKRMQGATPSAGNDFTTKTYVDGLLGGGALKKFLTAAPPVRQSNTTLAMDYFYAANSDGTLFITSSTSKTMNTSIAGLGGIMRSDASKSIAGTISVTSGSTSITGSGTAFLADFIVGDNILTNGGQSRKISTITDNVTMTSTATFSSTETGVAYKRGGVIFINKAELYLYLVSDALGINSGIAANNRCAVLGEAVVDLPTVIKTGTVNVTSGQPQVQGVGTLFLTEFVVGQEIVVVSGNNFIVGTISEITSNTEMRTSGVWPASYSSAQIRLSYNKYRMLPFACPTNGSGNLHTFTVSGFPWATEVLLDLADGTTDFNLLSSVTTTSTTALNLWLSGASQQRVPEISRQVLFNAACIITDFTQNVAPGSFVMGPTTGTVTQKAVGPISQPYNNGATVLSYTNNNYFYCALDSSGNIQYKMSAGNATGTLNLLGYKMTEWKG